MSGSLGLAGRIWPSNDDDDNQGDADARTSSALTVSLIIIQ